MEEIFSIPAKQLILKHCGKILDDDRSIEEYNIIRASTLDLLIKIN